jgi:predicted acylesterase/phospholipase RssA
MENHQLKNDLADARKYIRAQTTDPAMIETIAERLRRAGKYHYAGELYALLLKGGGDVEERKMWNKHLAFCIYKDPDQPSSSKFDAALHFLWQADELDKTEYADFLGIAGAIYKRKWQYDNNFQNLLFAEHYYREGFLLWQKSQGDLGEMNMSKEAQQRADDDGYNAINYAFVAELLAYSRFQSAGYLQEIAEPQPEEEADDKKKALRIRLMQLRKTLRRQNKLIKNQEMSKSAIQRLETAVETRQYIIRKLLGQEYLPFQGEPEITAPDYRKRWAYATLAEAYFGIGDYAGALFFYKKYRATGPDAWQTHTTAEQLMRMAEMHSQLGEWMSEFGKIPKRDREKIVEETRKCLKALYPQANAPDDKTLAVSFRGKVGIALSGGGFRAALFHIGVLARLAELDVLRHVEVISCVSGGSIAGAYYYMLLKREMERHGENMDQMHYVSIVREMETNFLSAVQKNLRMRIFANPWKNLRIFLDKDYSRTHRLGELYEKYLYQPIIRNTHPEGEPILMHNLKIRPADIAAGDEFNVKTENWNRRNKVPMLVLNATSLNTGHNWQFTASWMGEPPGNIRQDVDAKQRLRRMYYHEAPPPYRDNIRLGYAVGASSCVPVLFEPLKLKNLYPGIDVQLVDGGVHDNQGIASLLEQDCKLMIVSDASGQMSDAAVPTGNTADVFFRADLVLQERVREAQLLDLKARESASQITGLLFVHLKKELHQEPVNWVGCEEPQRTTINPKSVKDRPDLTDYGIRREVQQALSQVRTDLDAFNDAEAYALMYSGYAQTVLEMSDPKFDYLCETASTQSWQFMSVQKRMQHIAPSENLLHRLRLGAALPLKAFKTSWWMTFWGILLGALLLAAMLTPLYLAFWNEKKVFNFTLNIDLLKNIGLIVFGYLATLYIGSFVAKAMNRQNTLLRLIGMVIGAFVLAFISWIYLCWLNRVYLCFGRLTQLDGEDWLKKWGKRIWGWAR